MKKDKNRNIVLKAFSLFSQLGINMAVCVIIGVLLGKFLDSLLGTAPAMLLIFSIIGAASAIKVLYDTGSEWK